MCHGGFRRSVTDHNVQVKRIRFTSASPQIGAWKAPAELESDPGSAARYSSDIFLANATGFGVYVDIEKSADFKQRAKVNKSSSDTKTAGAAPPQCPSQIKFCFPVVDELCRHKISSAQSFKVGTSPIQQVKRR